MNRILQKYRKGQPSVGTFTHMQSAALIEGLGYTGLDYVIIDTEHSPTDISFVSRAITAADAAGITPLVRINAVSREAVLRPLDLGAKGLIVPAVESVEEVQNLISFAKFTPVGKRGFCPTRDGGWGFSENDATTYMDKSNRETLLLPQCETAECLSHIEEIVALEGVDGIFIGPLDLSIALGCPMLLDAPQMVNAVERVLKACKSKGKPAVIFCGDAAAAKERIAMGFDSVTVGLDLAMCIQMYRNMVDIISE